MPRRKTPLQPIDRMEWVHPRHLHANDYNPNRVFSPELALLKLSILEDGWTQPIVARPDGEIVDGFHRFTLASTDPEVQALTGGLVPVVRIDPKDRASQVMATVRHNRARGQHGILLMGEIVRGLREDGIADEEICRRLGMEPEELERLGELRGAPELRGKDSFGKGWVPDPTA